jgi:hypothetical protein
MSNLWVNLRIFYWHLQIGPDQPWVRLSFNAFRWRRRDCSPWIQLT